jgi:ketosteroid isomerase-like protein
MSQENANLVRSMYEAFARGDISAILATLDTQVEWWLAEHFLYADQNPYVGPHAVREGVFTRIGREWDGFALELRDVLDAGNTVIGQGYVTGTYKKNGAHVHAQFAHFFTFRDGKVVRFQQYTDTAQFREAVST